MNSDVDGQMREAALVSAFEAVTWGDGVNPPF
jgi:hypothetical protein